MFHLQVAPDSTNEPGVPLPLSQTSPSLTHKAHTPATGLVWTLGLDVSHVAHSPALLPFRPQLIQSGLRLLHIPEVRAGRGRRSDRDTCPATKIRPSQPQRPMVVGFQSHGLHNESLLCVSGDQ